jgi:hypothetical protein
MTERRHPGLTGIFFKAFGLFFLLNFLAHSNGARLEFMEGFYDGIRDRPAHCDTCGR